ncbi:carbohydrate-binding family 9-like protein [Paenibacillus glycanilyticus]|uniref:carbohydrate-binding family 9-like protein n=1 Tax=Paenibacillus glycanilyticus TaxID=126569 RepID=UPI00203D301A|nr:carbohydrate-binding family 9-like protein [Paenibacillus glycanilyticus]MCM3631108.1 carbohydrate-binding family 9-like protein [Paenibacillus glycanilyticus]
MSKYHEFPYAIHAAAFTDKEWRQLQPAEVGYQQWLQVEQPPETEVRGAYDEVALHLQFRVYEEAPIMRHRQHGDPVYQDSCVEFFLQPLPTRDERYLNFELNAAGVLLLEIGEPGQKRKRILPEATSQFGIRTALGLWNPECRRMYWELNLRVPFAFLKYWFPDFKAEPGTVMKGNFYKCGDLTPAPHYLSWSPVQSDTPNFHRSDSFGTLVLK